MTPRNEIARGTNPHITSDTNLDSEIERGAEEAMEAYILERRRDNDDGDKVI